MKRLGGLHLNTQGKNLHQTAYAQLRQMIVDGTLKPEEPLIEKELMEQLHVGRTPLREAMQQLQMDGTLIIMPRCGTYVRPLDAEEIASLYQARLAIEPEIAKIATGMTDRTMLQMFRNIFSGSDDRQTMEQHDVRFHRFLYQSTRNRYFERTMDVICFQDQRIRAWSFCMLEDLVITNRTHLEIIDCMLAGDEDAAREAMRRHILQSQDTAMSLILRQEVHI